MEKKENPNPSRNGFCLKATVEASRKETDDCVTHVIGDDTKKPKQDRLQKNGTKEKNNTTG